MAFIVVDANRTTSIGTATGDVVIVQQRVVVTSPLDGINGFNSADLTVINDGVVAGDLIGASVSSGSLVANGASGRLYGSAVGLWLNGSEAAVTNEGVIQSRGDGLADIKAALALNSAVGATIDNSGTITGGNIGVHLYGAADDTTLVNSGRITAVNAAITGGGTLALENTGTIVSAKTAALAFGGSDDGISLTNGGTIRGGAGVAIEGSTASDIVRNAGTLDGTVDLGNGGDRVVNRGDVFGDLDLGAGADSYRGTGRGFVDGEIFGGDGNDTIHGSGDDDQLDGGADNDVLFGRGGEDALVGGAGADTLNGGAWNDTLTGGAGNDVLTGGGGTDLFAFADGFDTDIVTDFDLRRGDRIDLSGVTGIADFADLVANHLSDAGGDAVIDAGDGDGGTITLLGVLAGRLEANDFVF